MLKKHLLFWMFLLLFLLSCIFYSSRWIFFYRFDIQYLEDWYNHSQWVIPLSPRIMGDAELYQLSGYKAITGDNLFHISPEVPPLGKYVYGFAEKQFGNPYVASIFFYFLGLALFFFLAKKLFSEKSTALFAFFLFSLQPLFFSQIGQVGLDLPQLCFLLLFFVFLFSSGDKSFSKRTLFAFFSGISLSAFTATKFGLFTPLIFLISCWYLWKKKKLTDIGVLAISFALTFPLFYAPFFIQGHSFTEWLSAEKWIVHLYASSKTQFIPGMPIITLITGLFLGWWNNIDWVKEWTLVWPLSLTFFLQKIFSFVRKKNFTQSSPEWQTVYLFTIGLPLTQSIIPFWPRYLILLLPFLLLIVTPFLSTHHKVQRVILFVSIVQFFIYLFPQPKEMLNLTAQAWQGNSYAEVYNFIDRSSQQNVSQTAFVLTLEKLNHQLESPVKHISFDVPLVWPWQNIVTAKMHEIEKTSVGTIDYQTQVSLARQRNQWRIVWQWSDAFPHFSPSAEVILTKKYPQFGSLKTSDGKTISTTGEAPYFFFIPNKVKDFETLNSQLAALTNVNREQLRIQSMVINPPDAIIPAGLLKVYYDQYLFSQVASTAGVIVEKRPALLTSPETSDPKPLSFFQTQLGLHQQIYGKLGGTIVLKDSSGTFQILDTLPQNGSDIILKDSFRNIFDYDPKK